jgi:hypothetical protein
MIVALAVTLSSPTDVAAISTYTSTSMSCGSIKATIQNQGAVIFRWTSPRTGNPRYNRYVRNANYCLVNQTTKPTYIPASNTSNCRVFYCVKRERNCDIWDRC